MEIPDHLKFYFYLWIPDRLILIELFQYVMKHF